jgi:molybdenum cofactor guanylyltransferase
MDALILAGGENTRIPLTKGFLEIRNRKIIETNIELLKSIFPRVILSVNNPELYFYLGLPMIGDVVDSRSPMTGILSVFMNTASSDIFVTACDMPYINAILIKHMIERYSDGFEALIPIYDGKPQPLFGIYAKRVSEAMERRIRAGKKSMLDFLKTINVRYINEEEVRSIDPEGRSFVNINTFKDYQREGGAICLG